MFVIKFVPPPISPLVDMADMDKAVTKVIKVEIAMITKVSPIFVFFSLITFSEFIVIKDYLILLVPPPRRA